MHRILLLVMMIGSQVGFAADYLVGPQGDDSLDGTTPATAFATIQRGIDALTPGDTLTILPGQYAEQVSREELGSHEAETVIRAQVPGSVLLHGDREAPAFEPVAGMPYVYRAPWQGSVEAVAELDTLSILIRRPRLAELSFNPGTCYLDEEAEMLYIAPTDLQPPSAHHYRVMVTPGVGLRLTDPKRVRVEGLAFTGFFRNGTTGLNFEKEYSWGLLLTNPEACTVRSITSYLTGGGIGMVRGRDNIIEHCTVYGNSNPFAPESGGIIRIKTHNDIIRDNLAYDSTSAGIRFYLTMTGPAILRNNLSWGNSKGDFWIKGQGAKEFGLAEGCIAGGHFNVYNLRDSLIGGHNTYRRQEGLPPSVIQLPDSKGERDRHFADPTNFDFRLQSTSSYRGTGPDGSDPGPYPYQDNVFYVGPNGDDSAVGTAVSLAWATLDHAIDQLESGDTLYLLPGGQYTLAQAAVLEDVNLRGRGPQAVPVSGTFALRDSDGVTIERLAFETLGVAQGRDLTITNSTARSFHTEQISGLTLKHNHFSQAPVLRRSTGLLLTGNLFDAAPLLEQSTITWSDYNGYTTAEARSAMPDRASSLVTTEQPLLAGRGPYATSIGPYRMFPERRIRLGGPIVHQVSDTSANLEWWTSQPAVCRITWGKPGDEQTMTLDVNRFASLSLTDLEPATTYTLRIEQVDPYAPMDNYDTAGLQPEGASITFTTLAKSSAPTTWYVAPDGDDSQAGTSRDTAFRTVQKAADLVRPGDTVRLAGGSYKETLQLRTSGTAERPITFTTIPGEKVVFDAGNRELTNAFILHHKRHIVIDGFYFIGFNVLNDSLQWAPHMAGIIKLYRSHDITIRRCLMNGRGGGYNPPFLTAGESDRVTLENCVIASGFKGIHIINSHELQVRHCVFLRNLIQGIILYNTEEEKTTFTHNIFVDSLPRKVGVQYFEVAHAASLNESGNCYVLRVPDEERRMFLFYEDEEFGATTFDRKLGLAGYREKVNPATTSIIADPLFQLAIERAPEGAEVGDMKVGDHFVGDWLVGTAGQDLDFPHVFATDEAVKELGCGLQPAAFEDFHFSND